MPKPLVPVGGKPILECNFNLKKMVLRKLF